MTDPHTLSLADLAAAVVRLGAHRVADSVFDAAGDQITLGHVDLLLAAANRLPAVVAECERLTRELTELRELTGVAAWADDVRQRVADALAKRTKETP